MRHSTLSLAIAILPLGMFAADVTGTWKAEFETQIGLQKYTGMRFKSCWEWIP